MRTTGMAASSRFLDPKVLARISNLELLARTVIEGFISGLHQSPFLGFSTDFAEHRAYMPGDDTRRVDWKLYARTDRYHVKQFEADTNANFTVLLDVSKSMSFGSVGIPKIDYARYLAACLTYFSHQQRDRVGLVTFDNEIVDRIPPSAKHLELILHTLDRVNAGQPGQLATPLAHSAELFRRRSMVVLISDFYEEPDAVAEAVKNLRRKANDVVAFHVLDPAEIDFPYEDAQSFRDVESGELLPVIPETLKDEYRALVAAHIQALSKVMSGLGIDYVQLNTAQPLDYALFHYLNSRQSAKTRTHSGAWRR